MRFMLSIKFGSSSSSSSSSSLRQSYLESLCLKAPVLTLQTDAVVEWKSSLSLSLSISLSLPPSLSLSLSPSLPVFPLSLSFSL
jgi:hypothetical protein